KTWSKTNRTRSTATPANSAPDCPASTSAPPVRGYLRITTKTCKQFFEGSRKNLNALDLCTGINILSGNPQHLDSTTPKLT
ncbi:hypothetical protein, partial [Citreimonas sp.]|uniref:hypothetical protein n=1 Tax=Citreimonas sp. TaxID=3036715 RepID=UPI004058C670